MARTNERSAKGIRESRRPRKLKVFRTAIGFHDAYVAAPSRKAALEAWGSDSNLFAQGIAEEISDPELTAAPLAKPGEVLKILRGTKDEQMAALSKATVKAKPSDTANIEGNEQASRPSPRSRAVRGSEARRSRERRPMPRPSSARLDAAEQAVKQAEHRHRQTMAELRDEQRRIDDRRRKLEVQQQREMGELRKAAEKARDSYRKAMAQWSENEAG